MVRALSLNNRSLSLRETATGVFRLDSLRVEINPQSIIKTEYKKKFVVNVFCNGDRTEWNPIRSEIIKVMNKIG